MSHTGRPLVRHTDYDRTMISCAPYGHLVQSVKTADWPDSHAEQQASTRCRTP